MEQKKSSKIVMRKSANQSNRRIQSWSERKQTNASADGKEKSSNDSAAQKRKVPNN